MVISTTVVDRRKRVRYFAAAMAGVTSLVYFLIGFGAVTVLENPQDQTVFGLIAGAAFLAATMILLFFDSRVLWGLGALAQAFIIFTYFNLAPEREPSFEVWGILIRVAQALLLGALVYLAVRPINSAGPAEERVMERTGSRR
jgi:hypothetical protein